MQTRCSTAVRRLWPFLLAAAVSGCASPMGGVGRAEPYPLGREYRTFQPASPSRVVPEAGARPFDPPRGDLTLRQALALALLHNPSLAASAWEVRAGDGGVRQAGLLPNPELDAEVENFGGSDLARGFVASETTIQLSQLLETAGKRSKRKREAASRRDLAAREYEIERIRVFCRTTRSFVGVLAAQERLGLFEDFVGLAEEVLEAVSERVRAGRVSPVEETRARVSLAARLIDRQRARHELSTARSELAAAWGGGAPSFGKALGDLERLPPQPSSDVLFGKIPRSPEVEREEAARTADEAALELEKAIPFPDLTVSGGVRWLQEIEEAAFVMGVSIPLPVFDRNQGGIEAARCRLARAAEERRASMVQVQASLTRALQRLATAREEARILREALLPGARDAFEKIDEGFRGGKFDYLQVLDAQRTFFEARARYVDSLAEVHLAAVDVEELTGETLGTQRLQSEGAIP